MINGSVHMACFLGEMSFKNSIEGSCRGSFLKVVEMEEHLRIVYVKGL